MMGYYGVVLDDDVDVACCGNTRPKLVLRQSGPFVEPCMNSCHRSFLDCLGCRSQGHVMVGTAMTFGTRTGTVYIIDSIDMKASRTPRFKAHRGKVTIVNERFVSYSHADIHIAVL